MGISRGERMDFSIQKAVELGVSHFQPLFTERCMVQLKGDRQQSRLDHWQGVIRHACEQSGRALLPSIAEPSNLPNWLCSFTGYGLMLDHRAEHSLASLSAPKDSLTLLVGPEGGLSQAERDLAMQHNFAAGRMGPRVLRTETAPLAALSAIQTLWGDFR
jgi:16S rRNA (uracil1498-N3)-methyltransferase